MSTIQPLLNRPDFSNRLTELAAKCIGLDWFLGSGDESITPEEAKLGREQFIAVSSECLQLMIGATHLFGDYLGMDTWTRISPDWADKLDHYIIPFALTLESDHLTQVGWWIGDGLMTLQRMEKNPSCAQVMSRRLALRLPYAEAEQDVEAPLIRPALFHNGQFRHAHMYRMIFTPQFNGWIETICESSRHNIEKAASWINFIHQAARSHQHTGATLKEFLGKHLQITPVDGLEDLRGYILGGNSVTGAECCERARNLLKSLIYKRTSPSEISSQIDMIRLNDKYFKTSFFNDLVQSLVAYEREFRTAARGLEFGDTLGAQADGKQLRDFFLQLALSDQDLTILAMSVTARFDSRQRMDLMELAIVDQMDAVMAATHKDSIVSLNPGGNLRHAILAAVLAALPVSLTADIAQKSDASRLVIYKLTGHKANLRGLQNKKLIDAAISSDLGL